jgi:hypothetical protein
MSTVSATPLLFNWATRPARRFAIVGFIALSVILHALGFYVFQIVYPANVALLPPPARVALIAPTSEENRTLLQWVDAEDPALASFTMRPPEARLRALPRVPHIPSYLAERPRLKPIPPMSPNPRAPSAQPPGPVPIARREAAGANASLQVPTEVLFSEDLTGLGEARLPAPHFTASSNEAPDNVRFRIAVNARGEIRYCFPINSSGDASLDEQARRQLLLARFPQASTAAQPDEQRLFWGLAIFEWGNDVAHPPPGSSPDSRP